jgi:hypothetical protein
LMVATHCMTESVGFSVEVVSQVSFDKLKSQCVEDGIFWFYYCDIQSAHSTRC